MYTLWSLALVKKSCNSINNSRAQVTRLCYSLWLWFDWILTYEKHACKKSTSWKVGRGKKIFFGKHVGALIIIVHFTLLCTHKFPFSLDYLQFTDHISYGKNEYLPFFQLLLLSGWSLHWRKNQFERIDKKTKAKHTFCIGITVRSFLIRNLGQELCLKFS